ncbi:MAG: hypothetical protein ABSG85_02310 [Spirochaetia bacterium]
MTEVRRRRRGIPYAQKWFARRASPLDFLSPVIYYQYLGRRPPLFFVKRSFTTLHIDLTRDPEAIQADMQKTVRYKVRRADGEGLSWHAGIDPRDFAAFHDAFARGKGIEGIDMQRIASFGPALILTRVTREGQILSQHAHIVDDQESRARLVYSSSGRFEGVDAALVGRANRWCHWKDMLRFKERGIRTYDLGGYAPGTRDPILEGINEFKIGFGGKEIAEDHWLSPLYALAMGAGEYRRRFAGAREARA